MSEMEALPELMQRQSQGIVEETLAMDGFLGFVGVTVGNRLMTISARESAKDPRQLLAGGCDRMTDHGRSAGTCSCGNKLPDPLPYW